ncbi:MAG: hypothetical protein QOF15_4404 [Mycobacterium sp.]|jgi:hypothetical protein|nr:hypothetical protein [Mycobacterium sp.]
MTTSRVVSPRPLLTGLCSVVALLGLAVATPTAHADGVDDQFLNAVKSKDINFASPQAAILAGHQVCNELDQGKQKGDVANDVASTSNLDGYHAGFFVGLSIAAFCPRHHASN